MGFRKQNRKKNYSKKKQSVYCSLLDRTRNLLWAELVKRQIETKVQHMDHLDT